MTTDANLALIQTLCTRLCHDLSGPVGAVASGAELLREDGTVADPELLSLLADSATSMSTRLRFLRAGLGVPAGRGLDPEDARALLAEYLTVTSGGRVKPEMTWDVTLEGEPPSRTRAFVQLLLNLCLLALETFPRPDRLTVTAASIRAGCVLVGGPGTPRPAPLDALRSGLVGDPRIDDPRLAHGTYTGLLARNLDLSVTLGTDPGAVRFSICPA